MMKQFIVNQKTHIIYGILLVVLGSIAFHLFSSKPKEIIKTEIKTKIVYRDVIKEKKVYVDKTTTIKKKNGDVVTIVDNSTSENIVYDKTKSEDTVSKSEVQRFMSSYTIDLMYPIINQSLSINKNPLDLQIIGGIRIFSLPVFLTAGSNLQFNQVLIGTRVEF